MLKNFTVEIADYECVATIGASGSGQSTIAALLQRLHEPASGSVAIGGHNIGYTDVNHLRDHVSVVSQNPNLFDATISDNIAYGTSGLSPTNIQRAARAANMHDFVTSLPQGYNNLEVFSCSAVAISRPVYLLWFISQSFPKSISGMSSYLYHIHVTRKNSTQLAIVSYTTREPIKVDDCISRRQSPFGLRHFR